MDFKTAVKYSFNVTLKESGKTIGWCDFGGVDFDISRNEIFYLISREYWGQGYGKEAAKAVFDYAFRVMKVDKMIGVCKQDNIASKTILQGLGLKFKYILEALPEEYDFYNGEPLYSLTREEYLQSNQ